MTIYIDSDYKCHTVAGDGLTAVETTAFDGKCSSYIEGYRYIPNGQMWTREDGTVFTGEMASPWKPWEELDAVQREYEREQVQNLKAQNKDLLSTIADTVEEVYTSDLEVMEA